MAPKELASQLQDQLTNKSEILDDLAAIAVLLSADLESGNLSDAAKKLDSLSKGLVAITVVARKDDDEPALEAIAAAKITAKTLKQELVPQPV